MVLEQQINDKESDDFWQENFGVSRDEFFNEDEPRSITKQTQTIKVPNTDARSTSKTLFGISIMLLGSSIVLWELRKKIINKKMLSF